MSAHSCHSPSHRDGGRRDERTVASDAAFHVDRRRSLWVVVEKLSLQKKFGMLWKTVGKITDRVLCQRSRSRGESYACRDVVGSVVK